MLSRYSEIVICSRFLNCELWYCDMNSTLGSVVPLAMFVFVFVFEFVFQFVFLLDNERRADTGHRWVEILLTLYSTRSSDNVVALVRPDHYWCNTPCHADNHVTRQMLVLIIFRTCWWRSSKQATADVIPADNYVTSLREALSGWCYADMIDI